MEGPSLETKPVTSPNVSPQKEVPFGVNEMRLNARQWALAIIIVGLIGWATPRLWQRVERFSTGQDYRIPYQLSKDYWLYARRMREVTSAPDKILLLGDSVVWGEYVLPDGTLSHFLNQQTGATDRFVNAGLNGLFPLAEEGLLEYYSRPLRNRKLIVHCNVLWMTSPKADLSTDKEEQFNHSRLVSQFWPRIPCYRADANERLSAVIERQVNFVAWVGHLQTAYFDQKSILNWTLEDDGGSPPRYPNAYRNPFARISFKVPSAPEIDPQRGPNSPRHRPWSQDGRATTTFDWVSLDSSLQWRAFQRLVTRVRERGNDVMVVLGPFNVHMLTEENRPAFRSIRDGIVQWFAENKIPHIVPEVLPSQLYADASHPLTEGYELLAKQMCGDEDFHRWLSRKP